MKKKKTKLVCNDSKKSEEVATTFSDNPEEKNLTTTSEIIVEETTNTTTKKKEKQKGKALERLKKLLPCLIFLCVSVVVLVIFLALRTNVAVCEFMTKNVMRGINSFVGGIANKLPFSAFEFFVVFCLCALFALIVTMIVLAIKKKGIISLKILCCIVGICFLFGSYYVLVAGFAYNREPIAQFCPDSKMDYWDYYEMAKWYKADYDALGEKMEREENGLSICPYTTAELNEMLKNEVKRLDGYFNADSCFSVKPMRLFSQFMSDMRISGITFMPTGDCGVNDLMPSVQFTSTAMHEMMHSVGIMRENEAEFMSCYLLISSENEYLRYCGYVDFYGYLYQGMYINATSEELNSVGVSQKVYKETQLVYEYWSNQKSITDKIGDFFNDLYLKLSGQKKGSGSYVEPTTPGDSFYEDGDRVFYEINYNNFQQAFMRNYLDKVNND